MAQIQKLIQENQKLKYQLEKFKSSNGLLPYVDDSLFKGGYRVVKTITDRNNIDCCHSKQGMIVCVIGEDLSFKEYRLISDCKNKQWEEIQTQVTENDVILTEDYSDLSENLTTQKELNLILKQLVLNLQTQIDNIELIDEKVQITENTGFAQIGQTQKEFNKNISNYKVIVDNKNIEQDERIVNLEGINYTWSPTNRTLTLYDNNGNQLSQVSLVSLDNEGTDIRYNASTLSLELYNADNELLDSIPVSSFIGSVGTQLQLNSNQLQLKDSQGNILSTATFEISNINGLQTILNNKQDRLQNVTGNIGVGKTDASATEKLDVDGNVKAIDFKGQAVKFNLQTSIYPTPNTLVPKTDGSGLLWYDNNSILRNIGENFFSADLSNTTARTHTMNASVTVNTLGNPHTLAGLPNKNADITNFRKVRVQNASGLDAVVDSKNMLTNGMTSMTDAEKDAWRLAQRKTGETYSTGMPIIRNLSRLVINSNISYVQYISLIGENLYVNPSTSTLKFIRVKDVAGAIITPVEYLIDTFTSYYDNTSLISFGLNFNLYPDGYYVLKVTNNGLESAKSPEVLLKSNYTNTPVSTNWTYIPPTYSRTQTNDILTTNSVELTGLNTSSAHQDFRKIGCVYESDFIITQEMIATNFLLEIQNSVNISGAYAHETIPTNIQILDYNNNVVAGLDLATSTNQSEDKVNILPQNSIVTPTPAMGANGLAYLLGQKISISYKDGVLTYFSALNQGLVFYNKTFIPNWDYTLYPMGFKLRVSIGGNSWSNTTVLSKKTQITNLTTI